MMQTEEQTGISDTLDQLFKDTPGILDALENSTMLNRTSDPSEQAVVVVYYLSDKSCCMSGLRTRRCGSEKLIKGANRTGTETGVF